MEHARSPRYSPRIPNTPDTPDARVEEYCVQYFLSGLHDADAKSGVAGITCATMAGALDACRLARSRPGNATAAKKARTAVVAEAAVLDLTKDRAAPAPSTSAAASQPSTSPVLSKLDELASELTAAVNQAASLRLNINAAPTSSSESSAEGASRHAKRAKGHQYRRGQQGQRGRPAVCFTCNQPGHIAANCSHAYRPLQPPSPGAKG